MENNESNKNSRIPHSKFENYENHIIQCVNQENQEIHRISLENH